MMNPPYLRDFLSFCVQEIILRRKEIIIIDKRISAFFNADIVGAHDVNNSNSCTLRIIYKKGIATIPLEGNNVCASVNGLVFMYKCVSNSMIPTVR